MDLRGNQGTDAVCFSAAFTSQTATLDVSPANLSLSLVNSYKCQRGQLGTTLEGMPQAGVHFRLLSHLEHWVAVQDKLLNAGNMLKML